MDPLLEKYINEHKTEGVDCRPEIFDINNPSDSEKIKAFFKNGLIRRVLDFHGAQVQELAEISYPSQKDVRMMDNLQKSLWVYYPWRFSLVHVLGRDEYIRLRTSRNFPLITSEEQKKFADAKIGFAGLNVGNPGAICITLEGGGRSMKFADFDKLSLSNLNRFRAGLCELGTSKAVISARQAYEVDPFIDIEMFDGGLDKENIDRFLLEPKVDLLIEEMDDLMLKIEIRKRAKKYKIPVIMVTAEGIIDVERYDLNPDIDILNGHLKKEVAERINLVLRKTTTPKERAMLARDFMGKEFLSNRVRDSFELIGTKISSIPQLSEWSFLRGAILCHFARMIITGEQVPSGRYYLRLFDALKNDQQLI